MKQKKGREENPAFFCESSFITIQPSAGRTLMRTLDLIPVDENSNVLYYMTLAGGHFENSLF
jgi:hypothetical protein